MEKLPTGWRVTTIEELCSLHIGGTSFKKLEYTPIGVPVLAKGDIKPFGRIVHSGKRFIDTELVDRMGYRLTEPSDLLLTTRDLTQKADFLGLVAAVPINQRYLVNQGANILRLNQKVDQRYFIYWCNGPLYRQYIKGHHVGSTQIHLRKNDFLNAPIWLPPRPEQHAIASILGALDDKIELNRQMNTTLEAIGQAIFKHWFVDFEFPNEDGKPYRSSGGEMVDSELGAVPEGWGVGTLGDICEITMGQSPPGKTYNEIGDGTPFYQGNRDFGFRFPTRRVYCTAPTRFAEDGDALLSVRAPVGSLNVAEERCAIGRGVAALRLRGKQHGYLYYLLIATQSGWNTFEAEGTVFGSANKSDVHGFKVVIPPNELQEQFSSLVESSDAQIITNEKQSRTLSSIRDTLLPKLMSGEIRVKGAEKFIEKTI